MIEIARRALGTFRDVPEAMRTIQISIGEIIEAMYDELMETYGDRELALVAAQALGDDLLSRARTEAPASGRVSCHNQVCVQLP